MKSPFKCYLERFLIGHCKICQYFVNIQKIGKLLSFYLLLLKCNIFNIKICVRSSVLFLMRIYFLLLFREESKFSSGHLLWAPQLASSIEGIIHLRISVFLYCFFSELWQNRVKKKLRWANMLSSILKSGKYNSRCPSSRITQLNSAHSCISSRNLLGLKLHS